MSDTQKRPVTDQQLEILRYTAELRARQDVRGGVEVVPEMLLRLVDEVKRLRADIAAAEERGRRRGVEEAANICDHRANGHDVGSAAGLEARKCANAVRDLASRDSGKVDHDT